MKIRVKLLCLLLTFCLLISMAPTVAVAANGPTIVASGVADDGINWTLDSEGTLTLSGKGDMDNHTPAGGNSWGSWVCKNIEVPTKWRYHDYDIYKIIIKPGITSIGSSAFNYCSNLISIEIPDSVTKIGSWAFLNCTSLKSITLPAGVNSLGSMAFQACTSLSEISFNGSGITAFETQTFFDCTSLESIVVPENVESIGASVFSGCTNLKSITFQGDAPAFDKRSFSNTTTKAFYPANNVTWTEDVMQNYSGHITWLPMGGVTRVFGATRYDTSFKAADELKNALGVSKFQNIIVACGTNFPDALSGTYLAAQKNAPILLTSGGNIRSINTYIRENLASGGTVYLLGSTGVVPNGIGDGINNCTVKRLGGATRYDTNLLILKEAGVGSKDIIVCTGLNFADSLSASATGLPILLVKDGLTTAQKEFLASASGKKIIVGGANAVNATVEKQLKAYGTVKRLAGTNRYETSVLVAQEFFSNPTSAVLAYAQNFPDGLSGGPLAYALKAPLILTDSNKPTAAVKYTTGLGIKSGYVLGGTGLISDKVVKNIFSMNGTAQIKVN